MSNVIRHLKILRSLNELSSEFLYKKNVLHLHMGKLIVDIMQALPRPRASGIAYHFRGFFVSWTSFANQRSPQSDLRPSV